MGTQHSSPARLLPPGRGETLPIPTPSPTTGISPLFAGLLPHSDLLPTQMGTFLLRNGPSFYGHVPTLAVKSDLPFACYKAPRAHPFPCSCHLSTRTLMRRVLVTAPTPGCGHTCTLARTRPLALSRSLALSRVLAIPLPDVRSSLVAQL